ncbi:MAG: hypothetical protein ABIQ58_01985, partial [Candidatus Limnocylindrales bacterium]
MRPTFALYPIWFALAFVTLLTVVSGVSPFGAIRALVITAVIAALLVMAGTAILRDRHRGGILGALAILGVMGGDARLMIVVGIAVVLLLVERYMVPAGRQTIRWARIGTIASRLVAILVLAIGIQAFQVGAFELVWR